MKRIALATCAGWPELTDDDRLLIPALRQLEVEAVPVVWDAPVDWTQFDQVILRSCWDYHLRLNEFLDWIEALKKSNVQVQNSPALVHWNADKRYLRQLKVTGASIPPTVWIEDQEEVCVQEILHARGWDSGVLKPTVSASAHNLRRVFKDESVVRVKGPAVIQAFVPEIVSSGEISLVFIGGEFSHSVVKFPTSGDFRVQSQFGGRTTLVQSGDEMVQAARLVLASLPAPALYARIDGIRCADRFLLMEVELIEPVLFLEIGGAADRLASAIAN